ncbi:MAG: shikimate kinase [Taibaiella sp.]|nr:shikimate kinase [Taibaiella sp.]
MKEDQRHIFLLGMPGSGKSKLGKKLALRLGRNFVDTDHYIESQLEMSIQQIFREKGEEYFRKQEAEAIRTIGSRSSPLVIATGGGLPCFHQNMEWMNQQGITVYLEVPIGILVSRIEKSGDRPMFKDMKAEEVKSELELISKIRIPFYRQGKYIIAYSEYPLKALLSLFQ